MPAADPPVLLWYRNDLRLADHAALRAALATGRPVLPVFVLDPAAAGAGAPGAASRWWLHHSLAALAAGLAAAGAPLVLRRGDAARSLVTLARASGAGAVFAGLATEPWARRQEAAVIAALGEAGVTFRRFRTASLFPPDALATGTDGGYRVYTPFARAAHAAAAPAAPHPAPARIPAPASAASESLDSWRLLPTAPDWADGLAATWTPGEAGARARLARFLDPRPRDPRAPDRGLADYAALRDRADLDATSGLSPHLHFGELSPAEVWHGAGGDGRGAEKFRAELLWREFALHQLWHHPDLPSRPLRAAFAAMPWRDDPAALRAWQRGRTGIPLVDAGMRQLWTTGWMPNRVRMVVASFLVKHLLTDWQAGAAWFLDTLVDADLAANSANWQWVAGCGADAAPWFRVFNPVLQGRRFDPDGAYVRRFVPELARLDPAFVHAPWTAPEPALRAAGIRLGQTYPAPIVDLAAGRARALAAFARLPALARGPRAGRAVMAPRGPRAPGFPVPDPAAVTPAGATRAGGAPAGATRAAVTPAGAMRAGARPGGATRVGAAPPLAIPADARVRVVGDVHGDAAAFAYAVATDRFVVQLGDLTDYGPHSDRALALMFALIDAGRGLFLLGNHDHRLARALAGQPVRTEGELARTLAQLTPELAARAGAELARAPLWLRQGGNLFVHGGFHTAMLEAASAPLGPGRADGPNARALFGEPTGRTQPDGFPERSLRWVDRIPAHITVYCGHDRRSTDGRPWRHHGSGGGAAVFLDTGAGKGGHLSWIDL